MELLLGCASVKCLLFCLISVLLKRSAAMDLLRFLRQDVCTHCFACPYMFCISFFHRAAFTHMHVYLWTRSAHPQSQQDAERQVLKRVANGRAYWRMYCAVSMCQLLHMFSIACESWVLSCVIVAMQGSRAQAAHVAGPGPAPEAQADQVCKLCNLTLAPSQFGTSCGTPRPTSAKL